MGWRLAIDFGDFDWCALDTRSEIQGNLFNYASSNTTPSQTTTVKMKLLTLNFLTCARKTCKSTAAAFPLHPKDAELEQVEIDMNALFIRNMLPRLEWEAMKTLTQEVIRPQDMTLPLFSTKVLQLGLASLPPETPSPEELTTEAGEPTQTAKDLHTLLMETSIASGKLVCGNCGHEYAVKEGIANFLYVPCSRSVAVCCAPLTTFTRTRLPSHMV